MKQGEPNQSESWVSERLLRKKEVAALLGCSLRPIERLTRIKF